MIREWKRRGFALAVAALAALASVAAACREAAPGGREVPLLRAEPELRIGSVEGDDPYVFGRISGLAMDDDGRIYVADLQAHEIRVFDVGGAHLFTFGRQGAGPGELSAPCCLAMAPDGRLWVRDNGNARYVAFDVGSQAASPATTVRMQHSDVNRHVATTFDDVGHLVDIGSRPDPRGGPQTVRFHVAPDGDLSRQVPAPVPPDPEALVHAVPMQFGEATGVRYFYQPFGPRHLVAHGPDGMFADAVSSSYHVRWYASDGSLLHTVERPEVAGPPLTGDERARADSLIAADARMAGTSMPFGVPQRHPPIAALRFDQEGQLWVQRTVAPDAQPLVDVYGRDGQLAARLELPDGLDLSYGALRPDLLLGVERDELGVQYVVRLRLGPAPRGP